MSTETSVEHVEKLTATRVAQERLAELYRRAVPGWIRLVERSRKGLHLVLIPFTLCWTVLNLMIPYRSVTEFAICYGLGVMGMVFSVALLLTVHSLVLRLKLRDAVLGELATLRGLAFHPNNALRRQLTRQGYVTLQQFITWHAKQAEILDVRASDHLEAARDLDRPTSTVAGAGAIAFLKAR